MNKKYINNISCPDTATTTMQNYTHNYQYDALGNMLQMQSVGNWTRNYVYNNPMTNNYLIGHGSGTVYTYDAHGNMLTMPHLTSMVWDYLDQLHSAANGTFTSYYNYDAEGKRTRKVVVKGNIREERYYIGDYEIYRKYTNNILDYERKTINVSDDEKVFVRIEQKTGENPLIRYQYDNHLGSACLELDGSASIISYEEYHPFGTTSYRSGRSQTEVSLKRYKYCGKERDEETGLYYYGMRYYAAWICRFVSVDPLQFKYPQLTPYNYAGNKTITHVDIDGMQSTGDEPRQDDSESKKKVSNIQYENFSDRVSVLVARVFSKSFRKEFNALKNDSENTYVYGRRNGAPNIYNAEPNIGPPEFDPESGTNKWNINYDYGGSNSGNLLPAIPWKTHEININLWKKKKTIKYNNVFGENETEKTSVYHLKRRVEGTKITLFSDSKPDEFTIINNKTEEIIQGPYSLGSSTYVEGGKMTKTIKLNTSEDLAVSVKSTKSQLKISGEYKSEDNSVGKIKYMKWVGIYFKFKLPF
ncbi:MAG: RHS repeat-associated core domain-containing protein [Bacteroidales bacterium]|nr:RHS repeat-associated core domain-containing protein [Bacteroidales bacterium]